MNRHLCIHGHFYQPPRENPWLEEVELQDSAYPYHDWNEKIMAECYAPNTASRILDSDKRIIDIVNNYSKISFNFGPTLLSWMQRQTQDVYQGILDADKKSQEKFSGHGSAIAQAYNHMIMPLANTRDKRTQVLWGIKDFEYRFKRKPEGMWLPETAVDLETLDMLVGYGIKFTILAPSQAQSVRKIKEKKFKDIRETGIDPQRPYLCRMPSGKTINIFFYDSSISNDIAFGDLLKSGKNFAERLMNSYTEEQDHPRLLHIGTDGETYGHHHRFGDMALAYCLYYIESNDLARITIYGEYLEKYSLTHEVKIIENTSWSCGHGVERWRADCGCCSGVNPGWNQLWRAPLREAMDWVRDTLSPVYEKEMVNFAKDPWDVRDNYIEVILDRSTKNVKRFLADNMIKDLSKQEEIRALQLLEMQRHAMLMYTSCGWFFDDVSGIETIQDIQYAARSIQLAKEVAGVDLEDSFIQTLERAPSNISKYQNGAKVYEKFVKPVVIDLLRVGAHYAVSSLFEEYPDKVKIYCYSANSEIFDRQEAGKQKIVVGRTQIRSDITWEEDTISFAVLHLGDHNFKGGVRGFIDENIFSKMHYEIRDAFRKGDTVRITRLIEKHFKFGHYSLWHLFRDEQSKILYQILDSTLEEIEASLRQVSEQHYSIFQIIKQLRIPLPKVLDNMVLFMVNKDLLQTLGSDMPDFERLEKVVNEVKEWSLEIDEATIGFVAQRKVNDFMKKFQKGPQEVGLLEPVEAILRILNPLSLNLDLWQAQNIYFSVGKNFYNTMQAKADQGNEDAKRWVEYFDRLGDLLTVKII